MEKKGASCGGGWKAIGLKAGSGGWIPMWLVFFLSGVFLSGGWIAMGVACVLVVPG